MNLTSILPLYNNKKIGVSDNGNKFVKNDSWIENTILFTSLDFCFDQFSKRKDVPAEKNSALKKYGNKALLWFSLSFLFDTGVNIYRANKAQKEKIANKINKNV